MRWATLLLPPNALRSMSLLAESAVVEHRETRARSASGGQRGKERAPSRPESFQRHPVPKTTPVLYNSCP